MKPRLEAVSWREFDVLVRNLAEKLTPFSFNKVYGVPRGGLVVAVALSHKLGVPMTDKIGYGTLVVDDVVDYSVTLEKCRKSHPTNYFVSLHYKERGNRKPDLYVKEVSRDDWIVYPWEDVGKAYNDFLEFRLSRGKNAN